MQVGEQRFQLFSSFKCLIALRFTPGGDGSLLVDSESQALDRRFRIAERLERLFLAPEIDERFLESLQFLPGFVEIQHARARFLRPREFLSECVDVERRVDSQEPGDLGVRFAFASATSSPVRTG